MNKEEKIKIELRDRWTQEILFSFEKENNTIKDTVIEAIMKKVSLRRVDLLGANLNGINLTGADLEEALLCYVNFKGSDLSNTNLRNANIQHATLREVNLTNADLSDANLEYAECEHSDFTDTKFNNTNFKHANLQGVINAPYIPMKCPEKGEFIGWKKVRCRKFGGCIVKLLIPKDANRSSATSNKCRCSKAKVLDIYNLQTYDKVQKVINKNYTKTLYKTGEYVYPDSFDNDRWNVHNHRSSI